MVQFSGSTSALGRVSGGLIAHYDEAIKLDSEYFDAYFYRASAWPMEKVDEAISDCTTAIGINPQSADSYELRGKLWRQKDTHKAINDFDKAIRIKPDGPTFFYNRGLAWQTVGENDKALGDFTEAVRLDPDYADAYASREYQWEERGEYAAQIRDLTELIRLGRPAHRRRGGAWEAMGEYAKAVADYKTSNDAASHRLAWILATCPDKEVRDGRLAVSLAIQIHQKTKWLDNQQASLLAAAYAEAGRFEEAVDWQEQAVHLGPEALKTEARSRLELYRERKAFRDLSLAKPPAP